MIHFILYIIVGLISIIYLIGYVYRKSSGVCTCTNHLHGKTVIVTGASAGIGKEAAFDFAQRGARVILACRNLEKADEVKDCIISSTGNKNVICRHLELSDLDSVRRFAQETIQKEDKINILVNNAGIYKETLAFSKQDYELTLATNHYGPFLLTNLLLDLIVKSAPSRIINVSSLAHKYSSLDFDDLHFKRRTYSHWNAYGQSKLANILFTKELARRLADKGIANVTVNSLHPGVVNTEIINKSGRISAHLVKFLTYKAIKTSKLGAQTTIHLAVSDKVKNITGEYFVDCEIAGISKRAKDPHLARELWLISEKEVCLTEEEKYF